MISRERYLKLREQTRRYEAARKKYDPKRYQRGGGYTPKERVLISVLSGVRDTTNEEKSLIEDYEWRMFPPSRYFAYYDSAMTKITGFMGNLIGRIVYKGTVQKVWGGKRQNVTIRGTNNVMYSGVCNLTGGTYCRMKRVKGRGPGTLPNASKKRRKVAAKKKPKYTYEQILNYYAKFAPRSRRNGGIAVGDKVKVSGKFLRSTGQYTGPVGQAKGVVTGLQDLGGIILATVVWDRSGVGPKFNVKNLLKAGTPEHFENRRRRR